MLRFIEVLEHFHTDYGVIAFRVYGQVLLFYVDLPKLMELLLSTVRWNLSDIYPVDNEIWNTRY